LNGAWTPLRLALYPTLRLGECYMDGSLQMVEGGVYDLCELIGRNFAFDPVRAKRFSIWRRAWFWVLRHVRQINNRITARRNVAHHYDISNAL
ncbi:hypothetical protein ABTM48_19555, partial [Acinetobacter baumannii]